MDKLCLKPPMITFSSLLILCAIWPTLPIFPPQAILIFKEERVSKHRENLCKKWCGRLLSKSGEQLFYQCHLHGICIGYCNCACSYYLFVDCVFSTVYMAYHKVKLLDNQQCSFHCNNIFWFCVHLGLWVGALRKNHTTHSNVCVCVCVYLAKILKNQSVRKSISSACNHWVRLVVRQVFIEWVGQSDR